MNRYQQKVQKLREELKKTSIYLNDPGVKRVYEISREIYSQHLDIMNKEVLLRLGGELLGIYFSFGNKHSASRAEYDIKENAYKQVVSNVTLDYLGEDSKYKVTEARSLAQKSMEEESDDVLHAKEMYQQWDNAFETTKTLIMFIQSALASKKNELYGSKELLENG